MTVAIAIPVVLLFLLLLTRCLCEFGLKVPVLSSYYSGDVLSKDKIEGYDVRKVFSLSLLFRLVMLAAMALGAVVVSEGHVLKWSSFENLFKIWDAGHYGNLVDLGYSDFIEDGQHLFLVFFPLYVWVTRFVKFFVQNTTVAGLIVSFLSYSFGCCYMYRIAARFMNKEAAYGSVLLLAAFPYSFFYGMVMTESLFLLTVSAACYYALEHKWLSYALWGVCAALTRMVGVLVVLVGVIEFFRMVQPFRSLTLQSIKKVVVSFAKGFVILFLPVLGTCCYFLLNYTVDGNPFAFLVHQQHWHQGYMNFPDVVKYMYGYCNMPMESWDGSCWFVWVPSLVLFAVLLVVMLVTCVRKEIPVSLCVFIFSYFVANYSLSWLLSAPRYMSGGFVFFVLIAYLLRNRPRVCHLLVSCFAVFYGILFVQYLNWQFIM